MGRAPQAPPPGSPASPPTPKPRLRGPVPIGMALFPGARARWGGGSSLRPDPVLENANLQSPAPRLTSPALAPPTTPKQCSSSLGGVLDGSDTKESACKAGDLGSTPWLGGYPWRREQLPTPVFLPGESHGQRSQVGYSPWGHKESDTTERFSLSSLGTSQPIFAQGTPTCAGPPQGISTPLSAIHHLVAPAPHTRRQKEVWRRELEKGRGVSSMANRG